MITLHEMCCIAVARAETSARLKGTEGYEQEGVSGLKALGVRDLGYKMAFLANNVLQSKTRVSFIRNAMLLMITRLYSLVAKN